MPAGPPEAVRQISTDESTTLLREATVSHHPVSSLRAAGRLALTFALLGWLTLPGRTETPDSEASRKQSIADIEKQIKDLQSKLDEMKASSAHDLQHRISAWK